MADERLVTRLLQRRFRSYKVRRPKSCTTCKYGSPSSPVFGLTYPWHCHLIANDVRAVDAYGRCSEWTIGSARATLAKSAGTEGKVE